VFLNNIWNTGWTSIKLQSITDFCYTGCDGIKSNNRKNPCYKRSSDVHVAVEPFDECCCVRTTLQCAVSVTEPLTYYELLRSSASSSQIVDGAMTVISSTCPRSNPVEIHEITSNKYSAKARPPQTEQPRFLETDFSSTKTSCSIEMLQRKPWKGFISLSDDTSEKTPARESFFQESSHDVFLVGLEQLSSSTLFSHTVTLKERSAATSRETIKATSKSEENSTRQKMCAEAIHCSIQQNRKSSPIAQEINPLEETNKFKTSTKSVTPSTMDQRNEIAASCGLHGSTNNILVPPKRNSDPGENASCAYVSDCISGGHSSSVGDFAQQYGSGNLEKAAERLVNEMLGLQEVSNLAADMYEVSTKHSDCSMITTTGAKNGEAAAVVKKSEVRKNTDFQESKFSDSGGQEFQEQYNSKVKDEVPSSSKRISESHEASSLSFQCSPDDMAFTNLLRSRTKPISTSVHYECCSSQFSEKSDEVHVKNHPKTSRQHVSSTSNVLGSNTSTNINFYHKHEILQKLAEQRKRFNSERAAHVPLPSDLSVINHGGKQSCTEIKNLNKTPMKAEVCNIHKSNQTKCLPANHYPGEHSLGANENTDALLVDKAAKVMCTKQTESMQELDGIERKVKAPTKIRNLENNGGRRGALVTSTNKITVTENEVRVADVSYQQRLPKTLNATSQQHTDQPVENCRKIKREDSVADCELLKQQPSIHEVDGPKSVVTEKSNTNLNNRKDVKEGHTERCEEQEVGHRYEVGVDMLPRFSDSKCEKPGITDFHNQRHLPRQEKTAFNSTFLGKLTQLSFQANGDDKKRDENLEESKSTNQIREMPVYATQMPKISNTIFKSIQSTEVFETASSADEILENQEQPPKVGQLSCHAKGMQMYEAAERHIARKFNEKRREHHRKDEYFEVKGTQLNDPNQKTSLFSEMTIAGPSGHERSQKSFQVRGTQWEDPLEAQDQNTAPNKKQSNIHFDNSNRQWVRDLEHSDDSNHKSLLIFENVCMDDSPKLTANTNKNTFFSKQASVDPDNQSENTRSCLPVSNNRPRIKPLPPYVEEFLRKYRMEKNELESRPLSAKSRKEQIVTCNKNDQEWPTNFQNVCDNCQQLFTSNQKSRFTAPVHSTKPTVHCIYRDQCHFGEEHDSWAKGLGKTTISHNSYVPEQVCPCQYSSFEISHTSSDELETLRFGQHPLRDPSDYDDDGSGPADRERAPVICHCQMSQSKNCREGRGILKRSEALCQVQGTVASSESSLSLSRPSSEADTQVESLIARARSVGRTTEDLLDVMVKELRQEQRRRELIEARRGEGDRLRKATVAMSHAAERILTSIAAAARARSSESLSFSLSASSDDVNCRNRQKSPRLGIGKTRKVKRRKKKTRGRCTAANQNHRFPPEGSVSDKKRGTHLKIGKMLHSKGTPKDDTFPAIHVHFPCEIQVPSFLKSEPASVKAKSLLTKTNEKRTEPISLCSQRALHPSIGISRWLPDQTAMQSSEVDSAMLQSRTIPTTPLIEVRSKALSSKLPNVARSREEADDLAAEAKKSPFYNQKEGAEFLSRLNRWRSHCRIRFGCLTSKTQALHVKPSIFGSVSSSCFRESTSNTSLGQPVRNATSSILSARSPPLLPTGRTKTTFNKACVTP